MEHQEKDISKLRHDYVIVSTVILVTVVAVVGLLTRNLWDTTISCFPFYAAPLLVTIFLMYQVNYTWPLFTLYVSSLLYGAYFAYLCFLPHDPFKIVVLLLAGFPSLFVMVPLWGLAIFLHLYKKNWNKPHTET